MAIMQLNESVIDTKMDEHSMLFIQCINEHFGVHYAISEKVMLTLRLKGD